MPHKPITLGQEVEDVATMLDNLLATVAKIISDNQEKLARLTSGREQIARMRADLLAEGFYDLPASADYMSKRSLEAVWRTLARLMSKREKFTMTEAGEELERYLGRKLGKNRPQAIRNNLIRHPEKFRQNEDGTWTVVGIEKEVASEKATS